MPELSIVMPVYNEEKLISDVIEEFYEKIVRKVPDCEFIVCEDGSTDKTRDILKGLAKKYPIKLYTDEKKKGYLLAARDAISLANGEWILFSDSDGQHFAEDFWKLSEKKEHFDLICGSRAQRNDPIMRKFLSFFYNFIMGSVFGIKIRDFNAGFKLMKKSVAKNAVPKISKLQYGFSTELVIRAHHMGFKVCEVPVGHRARAHGTAEQFTVNRIPRVVVSQLKGMIDLKKELSVRG